MRSLPESVRNFGCYLYHKDVAQKEQMKKKVLRSVYMVYLFIPARFKHCGNREMKICKECI
jgi:hypothetical protein